MFGDETAGEGDPDFCSGEINGSKDVLADGNGVVGGAEGDAKGIMGLWDADAEYAWGGDVSVW